MISHQGNSLAVQWLGLHDLTAEGMGSIPGWGTKIPQSCAAWPGGAGGNQSPRGKQWSKHGLPTDVGTSEHRPAHKVDNYNFSTKIVQLVPVFSICSESYVAKGNGSYPCQGVRDPGEKLGFPPKKGSPTILCTISQHLFMDLQTARGTQIPG